MRRPTRTRRLSIAAIVSLLAFLVVAAIGVRSFWNYDAWQSVSNGRGRAFVLVCGRVGFIGGAEVRYLLHGHTHFDHTPDSSDVIESLWRFNVLNRSDGLGPQFGFDGPIWPLLLLLLIVPVRWLISRPANAPAFPVITDAKQELS